MIVHDAPQGTIRWLNARMGIPTASCFDKIMTPGGKLSASRISYMNTLLAERIMGHPAETFTSPWMARGNEFEAKAVESYEFQNDCDTETVGFVTNDEGTIGASPDRLIRQYPKGLLETKCPSPGVHVAYLLASTGAASEYKIQVQGQLWICEKEWADIISYHPDMPQALFRVNRDDTFIKDLSAIVLSFSRELEEKSAELTERGWIKTTAEIEESTLGISSADLAWMVKGVHYE